MSHQSESSLEATLIAQLQALDYDLVTIRDEADLLANFRKQLQLHNNIILSEMEFVQVLNHLNKGDVFEKAQILRDKMQLTRDDGTTKYIEFLNMEHRCRNEYQVTNQIGMEGNYKNRYDVTILINGLPLVQIELKRRGLELKEAFNQTNRYHRHSYETGHGLFQYIQLFVISNGVNTKYYSNNRKQSFKQTFFRANKENNIITKLEDFTKEFLKPCHLSKMITKYTVLTTQKILMVLRPYQYYAAEAIVHRVENSAKNGYIRHTTGSGKTLTSFKTSQILVENPDVDKVVFVVDRKDLDFQTIKEFNNFAEGSVDGTDNTTNLVKQLGNDTKLIVTTIQKLNTAITKAHYLDKVESIKNKRVVFIFDECHRSQFGETHDRIKKFFTNHQMFGFTGTPIFAENHNNKQTTKDLFHECLHKYVITDAIRDENVLKFSIEYVGKYKEKEGSRNEIDIKVEEIDTKELLESPERLEKIVDYIIQHHDRKTHSREFTAMFCVSSVDCLTKYYEIFARKKAAGEHTLRIATIFSYTANEVDLDADGFIPDEISDDAPVNLHTRDKLEQYIWEYNTMFWTKFTTKDSQSFYNYYNDISKKVKNKEIDILLVVNMFLTWFDSPSLNTMYVDKNLKYHGLIQAFSRTNRILNETKSQGNIICFRNLKEATDEAITLFSNKKAIETIIMWPYESYVGKFNEAVDKLLALTPTIDAVDRLEDEEQELQFVQLFRDLLRLKNILSWFADFDFADVGIDEQTFEDFQSKYLDIYDKVRTSTQKEKVSILDDVDFELELLHRDEVNVTYILFLLTKLKQQDPVQKELLKESIIKTMLGNKELRSKKELIEEFINQNLPHITEDDQIEPLFYQFRDEKKQQAVRTLCEEEKIELDKLYAIIDHYLFTEKLPLRDDLVDSLTFKPKLLERSSIVERITQKLTNFIETFIEGM